MLTKLLGRNEPSIVIPALHSIENMFTHGNGNRVRRLVVANNSTGAVASAVVFSWFVEFFVFSCCQADVLIDAGALMDY